MAYSVSLKQALLNTDASRYNAESYLINIIYKCRVLKELVGTLPHHSTPTKEHQEELPAVNGLDNIEIDNVSNKLEGRLPSESLIKTNLCPGKVVRRRKTTSKSPTVRASFPQANAHFSESRVAQQLEQKMSNTGLSSHDDSLDSSSDKLEGNAS